MTSFQRKHEKIHPDNALPAALQKRFESDKSISRSEIDAFRDRLLATYPSDQELTEVATAANPWEVLGRLETRPIVPSVMKEIKRAQAELKKALEDPTAPRPPEETRMPPTLTQLSMPSQPPGEDPLVARLRGLSAHQLTAYINNFMKTRGIRSLEDDPLSLLKGRDRAVFLAMTVALKDALKRNGGT